jgi:hypothetical protein
MKPHTMKGKRREPPTGTERRAKAEELADLYILAEANAVNPGGWERLVQVFLKHPEYTKEGRGRELVFGIAIGKRLARLEGGAR